MSIFNSESLKKSLELIGTLVALLLAFFLIRTEVRSEVKTITGNDEFLNNLASKINPYLIFDSNESYLYDGGALKYIEDIDVIMGLHPQYDTTTIAPVKIILTANRVFPFEPQISCLDGEDEGLINVSRGKHTTWIFDLKGWLSDYPGGIDTFRVDLIP
jgi:hypothetical protein